jgi:septal ring factor EnvC (AmiA/AmiB activator)
MIARVRRRIPRGGMVTVIAASLACVAGALRAQQPPASPPAAAPSPEARLRADRDALDQIRSERTALEQRMAELRGTVHDLSDEVANLDRQVDVTGRALRTLDGQLASIGVEVDSATTGLVHTQDELAIKRAMLRHRLVDIYKRGPLYSTQALLTADSFGALIAR